MKRLISSILMLTVILCMLSGCAEVSTDNEKIKIGFLSGPTAMGAAKLLYDCKSGTGAQQYEYSIQTEAAALAPALVKGDIDIAAMPANLASIVYNNQNGGIKVLAINTLGVLYIVERGDSIHSVSDLSGRRLLATGGGAVPEYSLRYILKQSGLEGENAPQIQWCSDTSEVLSYLEADETAAAMLPQPFVTAAQLKTDGLRVALDLNAEWEHLNGGQPMVTGVVCVRTEFAETHPELVKAFMQEYAASVDYVKKNTAEAAKMIAELGIVKAEVAQKALDGLNICLITGNEMKTALSEYLRILHTTDLQSVGGKLPDEAFYYEA